MLALCVLIGGALLPFVPYFVFQTIPYEDDIPNYFWPVMHRVAESLRAGQLPLWTGDLYNGFPLFADSESGALFPLNWVMIGWNTPQGFVLVLALSTALSAVCMYALARHLQFNRAASVIAGWVFALLARGRRRRARLAVAGRSRASADHDVDAGGGVSGVPRWGPHPRPLSQVWERGEERGARGEVGGDEGRAVTDCAPADGWAGFRNGGRAVDPYARAG
ncbi:MAG: hypothetical protein HY259_03720 [Chloroflexi bacterium]|nr:hypothetical protein [Chloroflexota bacterium]